MINQKAILTDLQTHQFTQGEIAERNHCSITTVRRIAKPANLLPGQGVRNQWVYTVISPELAYLLGVYLTDGCVSRQTKNNYINAFVLHNTSLEYIQKTYQCLRDCGLNPRYHKPRRKSEERQIQFSVASYHSPFAYWLDEVCDKKSRIPDVIFSASLECQLQFLCAAIDGDGSVSKTGTIDIRGIDGWLRQLPELLKQMGIRTSGFHVVSILPSGKEYGRVFIRRADFRELLPVCAIPEKQHRIIEARDTRKRPPYVREKRKCPVCGEMKIASLYAKQCRECYLKSDEFHAHLVNIAPKGSAVGNASRWKHR